MADEQTASFAPPPPPPHVWGPRYKETPADPYAPDARFPAEPWNTATAFLFVLIAVLWAWRLWGRFRRFPFITSCLPVLLAGGIGGILYHATRTSRAFLYLDIVPISLLGLAGAMYLTARLGWAFGMARVGLIALGVLGCYVAFNKAVLRLPNVHPNLPVNLNYASLAVVVLIPVVAVLIGTRFRYAGWIVGGLASFGIAWFCRLVDNSPYGDLPMGTHWLWHVFGAITTAAVTEYFYRLEQEATGLIAPSPGPVEDR